MDPTTRADIEAQSQNVRGELKRWELEWAKTHGGQKPGRDDIKQHADIAKKYKQYNKLRDVLSGKIAPPKDDGSKQKKRKHSTSEFQTPSKRSKLSETPSKFHDAPHRMQFTPSSSRKLFSPGALSSIGPTPQRDGRVLGLFDLLPTEAAQSPSRKDLSLPVQTTPSRSTEEETSRQLWRTPMSSSKRQMLDSFLTPLKKGNGNAGLRTPSSVSKLHFETPAFLKRTSMPVIDEKDKFDSPAPVRLPRKPLVRGLSAIVASLRKVEEDCLDDDLDALRDMEDEGEPAPKKPSPVEDVIIEDSQTTHLLGGFDDEGMYDSPVEEPVGRDGKPLKAYKKKGQKRTTRRSKMKPTVLKRPVPEQGELNDDDEEVVPETQLVDGAGDGGDAGMECGSDFDDANAEAVKASKVKTKAPKEAGPVKRAAKKVNELAHANFRRLKLHNKGSKGGPGYNSRFRRRR